MMTNVSFFSFPIRIFINTNSLEWKNTLFNGDNEAEEILYAEKCKHDAVLAYQTKVMDHLFPGKPISDTPFYLESDTKSSIEAYLKSALYLATFKSNYDKFEGLSHFARFFTDILQFKLTAYKIAAKCCSEMTDLVIDDEANAIASLAKLLFVREYNLISRIFFIKMMGRILEVSDLDRFITSFLPLFQNYMDCYDVSFQEKKQEVLQDSFDDLSFIMNMNIDEERLNMMLQKDIRTNDTVKKTLTNYASFNKNNIIVFGDHRVSDTEFSLLEIAYQLNEVTHDVISDYIGENQLTSFQIPEETIAYLRNVKNYPIAKFYQLEGDTIRTILRTEKTGTCYVLFQLIGDDFCYGLSFPENYDGGRKLIRIPIPKVSFEITK